MSQLSSASLTAVLVLLAAAAAAVGTAAPAGSACQNDIDVLKTTCYKYVEKGAPTVPPSPECCAAMEGVDVPCVCNYLGTPSVKDNISLEKVFYVTKQCGVTTPGNCGGDQLDLIPNPCTN